MADDSLKEFAFELVETRSFQRLRGISFLGIVDHQLISTLRAAKTYSRAEHSVGVMAIGIEAAAAANIPRVDAYTLVATALLHDLAHPAFSHSLEYAFSAAERELDHHEALRILLWERSPRTADLHRVLARHQVLPERLWHVLEGDDPLNFFFSNPLNIDTLDGIRRSYWSMGQVVNYDVNFLARCVGRLYAGATMGDRRFLEQADLFWRTKASFYTRFLVGPNAAIERSFQKAVRDSISKLERRHFEMSDRDFTLQYPEVIRKLNASTEYPDWQETQVFQIDASVTKIDKHSIFKRYRRIRNAAPNHSSRATSTG